MNINPETFRDRVRRAAERALANEGSVGPLELFQQMQFVAPTAFEKWQKGHQGYENLEQNIHVGAEKLNKTLRLFAEWIQERRLVPVEAPYMRRGLSGVHQLKITADHDAEREKFYCTRYTPADVPARTARHVKEKLSKVPDLVVFEKVTAEGSCSECKKELFEGALLFMEQGDPLCLECADLDHLVYLPRGDAALSRRARKHSALSAVVVRFSRPRRYERQGILVTNSALEQAERECAEDALERQTRREAAAVVRKAEDIEFIKEVSKALQDRYPGCPASETKEIAEHACVRGSGRVGRSAAAHELDPGALDLAVWAHVRHQHTDYDELLMGGVGRQEARARVRGTIEAVLAKWTAECQSS